MKQNKKPPHSPRAEFAIALFYVLISFLLLFGGGNAFSQTMVLQVDRATDSIPGDVGPNLKFFGCAFIGGGFVAGPDEEGAKIKYGSSGEFFIGYRAKYKFSPVYAMGWELLFRPQYFKLKQEDGKILPDTIQHKVERYDIIGLGVSYYNRFNFDPHRGNSLGKYLDIGISEDWNLSFDHITKDKLPDGTSVKAIQSGLDYKNIFSTNVFVRLGNKKTSLYARYRITDIFDSGGYPELPKLTIGLDFSISRY